MNLVLHIVRKDFQYLRLYLAGWLGLMVLRAVVIGFGPLDSGSWDVSLLDSYASLAWFPQLCLLVVMVARLAQNDSLVGSTAFWLGQPISEKQLLLSKSLFLGLTAISPIVLLELLLLSFHGVSQYDILRSLPQLLLAGLLLGSFLLLLAAVTKNLMQMILLGLLGAYGCVWFHNFARRLFPIWDYLGDSHAATLALSRLIVFILAHLAVVGIVVCHQYLTRRTAKSGILAVSGILLSGLLSGLWSWDFMARTQPLDRRVIEPEEVAARIEERSLRFFRRDRIGSLESRVILNGTIALEGLPQGLVVVPELIISRGSFGASASSFSSRHGTLHAYEGDGFWWGASLPSEMNQTRADILAEALGGTGFLDNEANPFFEYVPELLALNEGTYELHRTTPFDYSARVDLLAQRNEIATFPLEAGARYDGDSDHVEILKVTRDKYSLRIEMKESRHRLLQDHVKRRWYVLRNPSKRQALASSGAISYSIGTPPAALVSMPILEVSHATLDFLLPSTGPPVDPNWLQGAELVRIEARDLGRFTKTVRLDDMVMNTIPGP